MKKKSIFSCCVIMVLICTGCSKTPVINSEPVPRQHQGLIIAGSGANIPHIRILVNKFQNEHNLEIHVPDSIGSIGAVNGIQEGIIDLGFTSRPLSDEEKSSGLQEIAYAKSALIIACHDDVPESDIGYEDLLQIYGGEKTKWSNGKGIVPLAMHLADSTNEVLIGNIPGFKDVLSNAIKTHQAKEFYNDQSLDVALGETASAIGFTSVIPKAESGMKAMTVNGVAPSRENILNGSYRLTKNLYFIYKGPLNKDVKEFIDFPFSVQGKRILEQNGCISLSR